MHRQSYYKSQFCRIDGYLSCHPPPHIHRYAHVLRYPRYWRKYYYHQSHSRVQCGYSPSISYGYQFWLNLGLVRCRDANYSAHELSCDHRSQAKFPRLHILNLDKFHPHLRIEIFHCFCQFEYNPLRLHVNAV